MTCPISTKLQKGLSTMQCCGSPLTPSLAVTEKLHFKLPLEKTAHFDFVNHHHPAVVLICKSHLKLTAFFLVVYKC